MYIPLWRLVAGCWFLVADYFCWSTGLPEKLALPSAATGTSNVGAGVSVPGYANKSTLTIRCGMLASHCLVCHLKPSRLRASKHALFTQQHTQLHSGTVVFE